MKIEEAIVLLRKGKKVRKRRWDLKNYIYYDGEKLRTDSGSPYKLLLFTLENEHWEEYDEPKKFYTFIEVIPFLKKGKKIRTDDCPEGTYLEINNLGALVWDDDKSVTLTIKELTKRVWEIVE